jgi:hypothetical protein
MVTCGGQMPSMMNSRMPASLEPKRAEVRFRRDRGNSRKE